MTDPISVIKNNTSTDPNTMSEPISIVTTQSLKLKEPKLYDVSYLNPKTKCYVWNVRPNVAPKTGWETSHKIVH